MAVYESYCKECGAIVGKSKDIPDKDYPRLVIKAQVLDKCPHCGAVNDNPMNFKFGVRQARR